MIKYVKYLMHNHSFNSLIGNLMDWFQERFAYLIEVVNMRRILFNMFEQFVISSL